MSNKEKCIEIINSFNESQLVNIVNMLESVKNALDETADDAFCMGLLKDYDEDDDPQKHDAIPLEDFAKELGIDLK